jgi:uncharacterized membrane-anchored protein
MERSAQSAPVKVPAVTLGFWIIKVLATTLGETGGDSVSMSMNLGYLVGTAIFMVVFAVAVLAQVRAARFHPFLYWTTIVASLLLSLLVACLYTWHRTLGSISVSSISGPKAEGFYWLTIMSSQTLGTALGDWTADTAGLGYLGAALVFGGLLLGTLALHRFTTVSKTALFWAAFVLTRPLGAVVGDFLDKPLAKGGLELSRYGASAVLLAAMLALILALPQRPAQASH